MLDYKEWLHDLCSSADLANEQEATKLVQTLASELMHYHHIAMSHEDKLQEIMSAKDYKTYTSKLAKELFRMTVQSMPESEFKDFTIKHLDEITDIPTEELWRDKA